ncbi:hypothetical protein FA95DRAFT_1601991 [Auriscalpium vulgare]|uniref:Uncharacterized protein n=1 Tax=Auriscalpium vulgare TaxID=40419 RepID=A0ACB8S8Y6_9AGAM|nr:hypothetical protein FA95DRAFT_1601991 [Auriscalpium vulgare]
MTVTDSQTHSDDAESSTEPIASSSTVGTLRLRGGPRNRPRVTWVGETVDNEGMGKKKTKICCIYHKPKRFDESSDEDSSDSDSDSDGRARPTQRRHHHHHHDGQGQRDSEGTDVHEEIDRDDRNAYELVPRSSKGKGKAS